jgi:DNA adenine methylase
VGARRGGFLSYRQVAVPLPAGTVRAVPASPVSRTPTVGLPLLKWVGGKKKLLPALLPYYGGQPHVVEPFFGGGALSFRLAATHPSLVVTANDWLAPVMEIYTAVRDDADGFVAGVDRFADPYLRRRTKASRRAYFYDLRQRYMERAVDGPEPLFFLLWTAYSGMFRTGKEFPGRFNTSHGFGTEKPGFYHPDRLRATAPLMAGWDFNSGDFAATLGAVTADSFVFLDPPYRGTYDGYTDAGFSDADQLRVVEFFKACDRAGATVVYTNKDLGDDFYDRHFGGFTIERVPIRYTVNRNAATVGRPLSYEVVVSNAPPRPGTHTGAPTTGVPAAVRPAP